MVWATPPPLSLLVGSVATPALVTCLQPLGQEGLSALSKGLLSFLRLRQRGGPGFALALLRGGTRRDPSSCPTYVPQVGAGRLKSYRTA